MSSNPLGEMLAAALSGERPTSSEPIPATREQVLELLEGTANVFAVGDIVKWRNERLRTHAIPGINDEVIVTRVLATPINDDHNNPQNIAVALAHRCGDPSCKREGAVIEILLDGRRMERVGTIHN